MDSNRTRVGFVEEVTPGTTPANPVIKNLRIKASSLSFTPGSVESQELRTDRQIADLIRVRLESGGGLPMEFSFGSLDDLLEPVMFNRWRRTPVRTNLVAGVEITSVVVTTGVYNFLTTGTENSDKHYGAFAIGQMVRASGFAQAANNTLRRATAATATSVTLGNTSVAEASPPVGARLKAVGFQGASADVTATATGLSCTALNFTLMGLSVGTWLKIGGPVAGEQFATAANNTFVRVSGTPTATALPLDNLPAGWTIDAGAGKTITVYVADLIYNGTTSISWSLEQAYTDLTIPEWDYLVGQYAELAFAFRAQDIVEATATFTGMNATNVTTRAAGATDIAAPTNDVMNTSSNIGQITEGGTALVGPTAVTSVDLTLTNSLRRRPVLGLLGSHSIGAGAFRCKARVSMFYANNQIRTKILSGVASSFWMRVEDPGGARGYIFDIPRMKYETGNPNIPGIDTDRTMDPEFSGIASPQFGYTLGINRFEEYFEA